MRFEHEINQGKNFLSNLEIYLSMDIHQERDNLLIEIDNLKKKIEYEREQHREGIENLKLKIARHGQASGQILRLLQDCKPYINDMRSFAEDEEDRNFIESLLESIEALK